jgi:predicted phage terminase large subunit-like protein
MTETLDIETLQVAKVKCLKSLLFHTRYFFKSQYKRKFVVGKHHEIICNALERVLKGEITRLLISVPPRFGKTELAVKSFISHGLALNPAAKFIHLSYSDSLALDNSETVKDLIQSDEYQQLFPKVQIKKDSKAKDKWYTTAGGGVLARSAAGSVTGFGAGKVDDPDEDLDEFITGKEGFNGAVIIDDPIKPDDADSDTVRGRVNERFDSTIRNRVNSRKTPIIVIMQRLHPMDMIGYLQRADEQDEWTFINLPVINQVGNDYGLMPGEALWEFRMTVGEALAMKKANELVYERQYALNPNPRTGLMFPLQELLLYNFAQLEKALSDPDHNYVCADPADRGGDDFAGLDSRLIGNKIYIVNVLYNTDGADFNEPALVDMVLKSKASNVGIESVLGWKETAINVRNDLEEKGFEGEVRMLRPRTGKLARISNRASFIKNHFLFRDDYENFPQYAKFMRNLTSYLKIQEPGKMNKHDDAPDVSEMCAGYYQTQFPHLWPVKG